MTDCLSVLSLIRVDRGPAWNGRAESRHDLLPLVRSAGGCGTGFMLVLTDDRLKVLDVWRLPRQSGCLQGFSSVGARRLALTAKAAGMIVIQERDDPVPRRPDIELTLHLQTMLEETGVKLLDHILISGDSVSVCRPR